MLLQRWWSVTDNRSPAPVHLSRSTRARVAFPWRRFFPGRRHFPACALHRRGGISFSVPCGVDVVDPVPPVLPRKARCCNASAAGRTRRLFVDASLNYRPAGHSPFRGRRSVAGLPADDELPRRPEGQPTSGSGRGSRPGACDRPLVKGGGSHLEGAQPEGHHHPQQPKHDQDAAGRHLHLPARAKISGTWWQPAAKRSFRVWSAVTMTACTGVPTGLPAAGPARKTPSWCLATTKRLDGVTWDLVTPAPRSREPRRRGTRSRWTGPG